MIIIKKYIHIWDIPTEKVYVKLKEGFREEFFGKAHKKFKLWRLLGERFDIKRGDTLIARNWKDGICCCPLNIIFKIAKEIKISRYQIEKNIKEIRSKTKLKGRGGSSGTPVIDPKLPIRIDENLAEILGHICGDGTISKKNPKKGINLGYINSEKKLINHFNDLMRIVFGKIDYRTIIRTGPKYRKPNYYLIYPTITSLFILSIFKYKVKGGMNLPYFIYNSSKNMKIKFLRALFDDESTVSVEQKAIYIGLKPKRPILGIKILLNDLKIQTTKIYKSVNFNRFGITKQEEIKRFSSIIGFKHPLKITRLDLIVKNGWKFKRYDNGVTKTMIISLIKNRKGRTITELGKLLNRHNSTIGVHLNDLKKKHNLFDKKFNKGTDNNRIYKRWYINGES